MSTLASAGLVLFGGYALVRRLPVLARHNVPAPVVGGLVVALAVTGARLLGLDAVAFDTTLQSPLMIAFFTSIGFGASLPLLRSGGRAAVLLLVVSTAVGLLQNLVGAGVARGLGLSPLLGVIAGSVTLMGGPATALAFAPQFERAGVPGAAAIATASAVAGIVAAGLVGGPIGTRLISRRGLRPGAAARSAPIPTPAPEPPVPSAAPAAGRAIPPLLRAVVLLLLAMSLGAWVSRGIEALGLTLPAYIGAMVVAAGLRNLDDATGLLGLPARTMDDLGHVALSLFLAMALMSLRLWEIAGLALPVALVLLVQVALMVPLCLGPVFRLAGGDYEAAVTASGFCGYMLGITANAVANMEALADRYGPAPRSLLAVPLVGAFFIDFTNAVMITAFLNLWK